MRRATIIMRDDPHYRTDAVAKGLAAAGYSVGRIPTQLPTHEDVLVIWNRYGLSDRWAKIYEKAHAKVVVLENGYMGRDWRGTLWYAAALNRHNGGGSWPVGSRERARELFSDEMKEWREPGDKGVLLLAQRGIGSPPVAQPSTWVKSTMFALRNARIETVLRGHPGRHAETTPLYDQLREASCVVTWASGAAIKALLFGVPVYHAFENWIGAPAAQPFSVPMSEPFRGDRWPMLEKLAWAMWSIEEIANGSAFNHLLC